MPAPADSAATPISAWQTGISDITGENCSSGFVTDR
jgi:hypothetical protein